MNLIAYRRVSTQRQGQSGLGLEAQDAAIAAYAKAQGGTVLTVYTEVESGKKADRPELAKALAHCKRSRATFVIAKLDRLARNAKFLLSLLDWSNGSAREEDKTPIVFCDLPQIPAGPVGRFIVVQMANVAELEAGLISQRTKDALKAAKARGVLLGAARPGAHRLKGGANAKAAKRAAEVAKANADVAYDDLRPLVEGWRADGLSLRAIADRLNEQGHVTRRRKPWNPMQVARILDRAAREDAA
jgi:DNA invertase Pin-like site-specific DNA recombinase